MRCTVAWAAALAGLALGRPAPENKAALAPRAGQAIVDSETGFTFSEYRAPNTLNSNIIYRIAVPQGATAPFDLVVQVIAPSSVGWAGLGFGGSMVRNPLAVGYANGQKATVSSRWATGHSEPASYSGASYKLLSTGNKVNSTHWQYTAKCSGCSQWQGSSGIQRINAAGSGRLAWAASLTKVPQPGSNSSSLTMHSAFNYWSHDFYTGANANFAELLARNGG
ncbi:hypothetical protein BDV95DRAFT_679080 [Massariosphaeria phaeospora]|uniref:DOMON domain-containing protein n=1 Tax=Massariosphaeria phaeospora TaxID=100035 RepID=A0A7C8M5B4_9PLEO|nr:hypothetical protein BDV95DRAFT_679080 [Massariosphaeria phaeospora]